MTEDTSRRMILGPVVMALLHKFFSQQVMGFPHPSVLWQFLVIKPARHDGKTSISTTASGLLVQKYISSDLIISLKCSVLAIFRNNKNNLQFKSTEEQRFKMSGQVVIFVQDLGSVVRHW